MSSVWNNHGGERMQDLRKPLHDAVQAHESDFAGEGVVGHAQVGNASGHQDVERVTVVHVAHAVVAIRKPVENLSGHG